MENMKMTANTTYYTRSIGDYNCIFSIKVISRTEKTAKIVDFYGHERRAKIYTDDHGMEYIMPEKYSFAPVFRADETEKPKRA